VRGTSLARLFWLGAAGTVVLAALVALIAVLGGGFSDTDARILITLAAFLYAGGAGLAGLALAERGPARQLGRAVALAAPVGLVPMLWAIWDFVDEGENEPQAKLAWTAVLALLAGLIGTTALLLARRQALVKLGGVAAAVAIVAAAASIGGVWSGDSDSSFLKALAVLWILATVAYFLVPILERFSRSDERPPERRLATLNGIELVATRSEEGLEVTLAPGERLLLRRCV
jgi:hypothetical protein